MEQTLKNYLFSNKQLLFYHLIILITIKTIIAAPSLAWSSKLPNYDIWGKSNKLISNKHKNLDNNDNNQIVIDNQNLSTFSVYNNNNNNNNNYNFNYNNKLMEDFYKNKTSSRNGKVLNFFPVPVDDECLSNDGRRSGVCLNVYECRIQGGTSQGQCALGFGVCCVFTATCDQEVFNNITYIVSPSFPALMSRDVSNCTLKIKKINPDISQLRFDFVHFSMGQPNRRTGICDGDLLSITGGASQDFVLCGQNSGQHMYFDVDNSRADGIEMLMSFSNRFSLQRLWEIRVTQIPFSQRAPIGCRQYFTGTTGLIQTFNFAENGRHLANQDYRACVRQETGMCSISYEPCDDSSFRIGQNPSMIPGGNAGGPGSLGGAGSEGIGGMVGTVNDAPIGTGNVDALGDEPVAAASDPVQDAVAADEPQEVQADGDGETVDDAADNTDAGEQADDPDAVEGSGGDDGGGGGFFSSFASFFSRRSLGRSYQPTVTLSTQRSYRQPKQNFFSACTDRITLPCIVEDFIGAGNGQFSLCEPIHCGNSLCTAGQLPCRIETSVTPFGLGIKFGDGADKGSPEDNIGACLRYNQLPCL